MTKTASSTSQMLLPGALRQRLSSAGRRQKRSRISHAVILKTLQDPERGFTDLTEIYRTRILPAKTRQIQLIGRKTPATIIQTLLGYELKASYKRIQCPDLVTARYLKLFTELGCRNIRLPYDPTLTAELIPDLERSVKNIKRGVIELFPSDRSLQMYVIRSLYSHLRKQLTRHQRERMTAVPGAIGESSQG